MRDVGELKVAELELAGEPVQLVYAPHQGLANDAGPQGALWWQGTIVVSGLLAPADACEVTARAVQLYLIEQAVREAERKAGEPVVYASSGQPAVMIDGRALPVKVTHRCLRTPDGRTVKATVTDDAITVSAMLSLRKIAATAAQAALMRVFEAPLNGRTLYVE